MPKPMFIIGLIWLSLAVAVAAAVPSRRTVIYDDVVTEVAPPPVAWPATKAADLWITLADLTRATRFELKPKGVCRDELCFPLPKARTQAFLKKQGKLTWFNLSEFARLVRQAVAYDTEQATWFFGPRADEQNGYITTLQAPDFKLPDSNGKLHTLVDFRGKKVLLLTWASW